MKSLLRNSIFCLLGTYFLSACNEHTVYHSYRSLPSEGWRKSDTLFFQVPITDSIPTIVQVYAEVRNKSNYPYQSFYLFLQQNIPDSTIWKTDTLQIEMADKNGKWKGTGWGSLFQSSVPLGYLHIKYPGNYTFKAIHGMKDDILEGINDIGIRIEKVGYNR